MKGIYVAFPLLIALITVTVMAVLPALLLARKIRRVRLKLKDISEILDDLAAGNSNRKILAKPDDITADIGFKINTIVLHFREQIIALKRTEKTNSQLMTSLSHDVRTPLTTLIGYLDAAHKGIVTGSEREEYIETARLRAHDLKNYVDVLFLWFKLNSDEETFTFEEAELTELTRNLLKDWIPIFENHPLDYDIEIPETRIMVSLDTAAYARILNNLIQNVISHSRAAHIKIRISRLVNEVAITVTDDGRGIACRNLPHIFERLYKCDRARSEKGSGLGLSIVKQLAEKMNGVVSVKSEPHLQTEFTVIFPVCNEMPL